LIFAPLEERDKTKDLLSSGLVTLNRYPFLTKPSIILLPREGDRPIFLDKTLQVTLSVVLISITALYSAKEILHRVRICSSSIRQSFFNLFIRSTSFFSILLSTYVLSAIFANSNYKG